MKVSDKAPEKTEEKAEEKKPKPVTLEDIKARHDVQVYIKKADHNMEVIGYTEHGFRHAEIVSGRARQLLQQLGFDDRQPELAAIAAYLHDIGNTVNRYIHAQAGAMLTYHILHEMGMPPEELADVLTGVGNHEEDYGEPFCPVAAAVIIADKSDVDRSRVRNIQPARFDEHDRINYAAIFSSLTADKERRTITLALEIDNSIGSIMEYFERFLSRMILSRKSAETLGCQFALTINGTKML
jgi:metal-dependent HD superfamily phosphatase/phosphodiesterase